MLSVIYVKNLVGRWPLWIIFWVLEDGARRPEGTEKVPIFKD